MEEIFTGSEIKLCTTGKEDVIVCCLLASFVEKVARKLERTVDPIAFS
jgi:hypothetical protein